MWSIRSKLLESIQDWPVARAPADVPIQDIINNQGWPDSRGCEHICKSGVNAPTCNVRTDTMNATRRDYILVNSCLLDACVAGRVDMGDIIPTHQPVQVNIKIKKIQLEQRVLRKPQSAATAFEKSSQACWSERRR